MKQGCIIPVVSMFVIGGGCSKYVADDPVWDPKAVPEYHLSFDDRDWEEALAAGFDSTGCEDREYTRATLKYDNPMTGEREVYEDVGVRYRGHNIYLDSGVERSGYKISFEEFEEGRTFHGLGKINLLGTEGDYSLLHERLALEAMRDLGVPAPRATHAVLYVNGRYMGVFPNSEEPDDKAYVTHHFDDDSGSLYKVKGYCGFRADLSQDAGDDVNIYAETYEPKAGASKADMATDLIPMLACASTPDDAEFEACIEQRIDVDEWLTEIAVDMVLPDVDGMASAGQNFLLYHQPDDGRFRVYPWDKDLAFFLTTLEPEDASIFALKPSWLENSQPMLANRLRTVFADRFCARVLDAADRLSPATMSPKLDALTELLQKHIKRDPFIDAALWEAAIAGVRDSIRTRHPVVVEEATRCMPPQ